MRYFRLAAKAPTLVNPASRADYGCGKDQPERAESIKAARFPASVALFSFVRAGFS